MRVGRVFHICLHYQLLQQLDIGRDAANIWSPEAPKAPWAAGLTKLYLDATPQSRMALQALPLHVRDTEAYLATLTEAALPLWDAFAVAVLEEWEAAEAAFVGDALAHEQRVQAFREELGGVLGRLRKALWSRCEQAPPGLALFDTPSLGTHARMISLGDVRCCATSLQREPGQLLCQLLHEETHAISDPQVLQRSDQGGGFRDTRVGTQGAKLHEAIERAAVLLGAEIIQEAAPEWTEAYEEWRRPYGM